MLLKQLKYFVAVVDANSFTDAAMTCYVSQSAISQQMKALEAELGVPLLLRQGRHFALTEAGAYLYSHGRQLLSEVDGLCEGVRKLGTMREQRLRIGCLQGFGGDALQAAVESFSQAHPDVVVTVFTGTHEELDEGLRTGKADLVLNDERGEVPEAYHSVPLQKLPLRADVSRQSALSKNKKLKLSELQGTPCILVANREQQRAEKAFYQLALGFEGEFLFAESLEAAHLLVASGRGFLPLATDEKKCRDRGCKRVTLYSGKTQLIRNYGAFWTKNPEAALAAEFVALLQQELGKR